MAGVNAAPFRTLGANDQLPHPGQGRVDLAAPASSVLGRQAPPSAGGAGAVPGFGFQQASETNFQADMLRGNWEDSTLSRTFYSASNLAAIQHSIRRAVYDKSQPKGYVIDDQSADELKIIMRATFLQYSKNQPHDIAGQIAELNQRVVDWSVPHILSAVDHYVYYLNDISSMPVPLARSVSMSSAGTRTKPMGEFM
jgi:hypothetical protein